MFYISRSSVQCVPVADVSWLCLSMYPRFIVGRQGVYMIGMVGYIVYFSATCRVYLRVISRPPIFARVYVAG